MEVYIDSFVTLTVDRSEWPFTGQGSFTPGKSAPIMFESETDVVQNQSGRSGIEKHLLSLTGTDSLILGHPAFTLVPPQITLSRLPNFLCVGSRKQYKIICYIPYVFLHIHPFIRM